MSRPHSASPLRALALLALLALVPLFAAGPAAAQMVYPRRAMLVSIDGLRPDIALRADMPTLRGLMKRGSFTMWARTPSMSVTLPSHMTLVTGVDPAKHGVTWNDDNHSNVLPPGHWETVFELAHAAGLHTGLCVGKKKLGVLAPKGTADHYCVPTNTQYLFDAIVADTVSKWIAYGAPQFMFVHLTGTDLAGHGLGWGTLPNVEAAEEADRSLGEILHALDVAHLTDSTLIIVTSDHGGWGKEHNVDDPRTHRVPWVVAGPGVRPGLDLSIDPKLEVDTQDTFAMLCDRLALTPPRPADAKLIRAALLGRTQ